MNVGELKNVIKDLDDSTEVVMSKDGEGNSFSPLAAYGVGYYVPDSTWSGEHFPHPNKDPKWFDDMFTHAKHGEEEGNPEVGWECLEGCPNKVFAVCLWPTN